MFDIPLVNIHVEHLHIYFQLLKILLDLVLQLIELRCFLVVLILY
jgi:hypothetical protein